MEFSENTAGGLCPACLLQQAMQSDTNITSGSSAPTSADPPLEGEGDPLMSPDQLMALLPQFDQIAFIGRGGMGVVYKARQKNLDRFIALKILSPAVAGAPGFAERFSREARAMARLNHPNIIAVYDFGFVAHNDTNLCYITMELVNGSNLRGLIKQLTPAQALAIVPQICEALQYAHDIGIVHRDIKPENILVDKKGRVKIADFGLAKLLQQARTPSDYTLTRPDLAMGTPAYMAPEQMERPTQVDHRADVYSLGVVFYEMLTGELPRGRFQLPSQKVQIDVRFDEVVLKALEHDPDRRYQHASEVQTSVESVRNTPMPQPVPTNHPPVNVLPSPQPDAPATPHSTPRLSRMAVIAAICGLIGMLVAPLIVFAAFNIQRVFDQFGTHYEWEPSWAVSLFFTSAIIAGLAAAAMTFLGVIAVPRIRRSPEKLYGLRLALFDALLCPLLLLDAIILESLAALAELNQHNVLSLPLFILALVLTLPCDVGLYWLVWRKLRVAKHGTERDSENPRFPLTIKLLAVASAVTVLALFAGFFAHAAEMTTVPIVAVGFCVMFVVAVKSFGQKQIRRAREIGLWPASGEIPTLEHVKRLAAAGESILAIRLYRQMHPVSLAEAHAVVEKMGTPDQPFQQKVPRFDSLTGVPVAREPGRFYANAFGLYCIGWIAFLLLWNLGWTGFIVSVGIFSTIARLQANYLQRYRPEIVKARAAEPGWKKVLRPSNINLAFILALLLLFLSVDLAGDAANGDELAKTFNDVPALSDTTQDFLKNYQGTDANALAMDVRDLSVHWQYSLTPAKMSIGIPKMPHFESSPLTSLDFPSLTGTVFHCLIYPSAIPPELRPLPNCWILGLAGLYFFMAGFADMLASKRMTFSGLAWKPAFSLAAILFASYLTVFFCSNTVFSFVRTSQVEHGEIKMRSTAYQILSSPQPSADRLFPALDRWALANGYEIAAILKGDLEDSHRLPTVPTGVTYEAAILWKPGLFDRLGLDWEGIYSKAPELLIESASTDTGSYTWVTLPAWSQTRAENDAGNMLQQNLYKAIETDFATTQPSTNPSPAKESSANHQHD
jgi:serine/threonine protein kinase